MCCQIILKPIKKFLTKIFSGSLGLVHWDDPEGWFREGGGRGPPGQCPRTEWGKGITGPQRMLGRDPRDTLAGSEVVCC